MTKFRFLDGNIVDELSYGFLHEVLSEGDEVEEEDTVGEKAKDSAAVEA